MTAVVPDDENIFQDGSASPQDSPSSPGSDLNPDPQPQPPPPEATRRQAVPHVRQISIAYIVRDVSGPDPLAQILWQYLSYLGYLTYSAHLDNFLTYLGDWNYLTHFCSWLESVGSRVP